jgi:hypothetical protein
VSPGSTPEENKNKNNITFPHCGFRVVGPTQKFKNEFKLPRLLMSPTIAAQKEKKYFDVPESFFGAKVQRRRKKR